MQKPLILIVEDELIVARDISARVTRQGYHVSGVVGSGEEAIESARASRPDLILMDIKLGSGIDGVTAAERIKERDDIPVVYLTAYADEHTLQRAKVTDAFGYLLKPFEERELHITIEMALYKHRMEKHHRDRERWLSTTLTSIGDGVISTDPAGRVTFMNPAAEALTGWTGPEAAGRRLDEVVRKAEGGRVLLCRDGRSFAIEESVSQLTDERGKRVGSVTILRDSSERARLEEQLRQAAKMESIGTLASGIAHDFNNILNNVLGFAGQIGKHVGDHEKVRRYVQTIEQSALRGAELCTRLLSFARKSKQERVATDLCEVTEEIATVCRETFPRTITVEAELQPGLPMVLGDRAELYQVLLNLCVNARDAIQDKKAGQGGRIRIGARGVTTVPRISPALLNGLSGHCVELTVSDNGIGMSKEILGKIFDPFFTTKERGEGTGLGLSMVYSIIRAHRGALLVDSEPGIGTTFTIYLPQTAEAAVPRERSAPASAGTVPAGNGELILVVDDEPSMLELARELLQEHGYRVLTANNGRKALEIFREHIGGVHLVLLDLMMPEMDGRTTLAEMKVLATDVKAILCTGFVPEEVSRSLTDVERRRILNKPFDPVALFRLVRAVLDDGPQQAAGVPAPVRQR